MDQFWRSRRVFVTGHTGFKGAWLSLWLHEMGAPRISTNMRLGTRTDRVQTMEDKVRSVTEKLQL